MKKFYALFFCIFTLQAAASPHFSRQWTRKTISNDYLGFLQFNRMKTLITGDLVIQGNAIDGIKAFNRKTGNQVWSITLKNGVEGGAVADNGKLYFGAGDGNFYCLNLEDGKILWQKPVNSESLTHPLIEGSSVYHVTGNNTLHSFDKNSGQSLWVKTNAAKANMTVRGQTAPVYSYGNLYLGFSDGSFSAINAQNGRELWSKRIGDDKKFNDVDATVVLTPSCLLVSSYANALYCLSQSSGAILWRHDFGGYNSVYVDKDKIYYPTVSGEIHILDLSSGKLLKKIVNIAGLATQIVGFSNYFIYGESSGSLILRDKNTLEKVSSFAPGRGLFATPSIDQETGEVYFISNQANLYRLDIQSKPENRFLWSQK